MIKPKGGMSRFHTKEEKLRCVKMIIEEKSNIEDVMRITNISKLQIAKWVNLFLEQGEERLDNKRKHKNPLKITKLMESLDNLEKLTLENMKLRVENERLKRGYAVESVNQNKDRFRNNYQIIERLSSEFSVELLCKIMNVSRSGYYKWLKRKGSLNSHQKHQVRLKNEISKIHLAHKTWGYRRIAQEIRNRTGLRLSDNLCHRCCKSLNIRSYVRKKNKVFHGNKQTIYKNLIASDWNTNRPFEKICTDTTSFYNNGRKYDLTMYVDVFNNEIVAYNLSKCDEHYNFNNHLIAMKNLIRNKIKRGYNEFETIVHSDQGYIYTTNAFEMSHKDSNITRSMNRAATPTDNPIIESLNGWIKDELINEYNLEQTLDIRKTIRRYINYFNNKRLAFSLKYKSPVQYRNDLAVT